jgi:hypothetical protein
MPDSKSLSSEKTPAESASDSVLDQYQDPVKRWQLSAGARWAWLGTPMIIFAMTWLLEPGSGRQLMLRWPAMAIPETCSTFVVLGIDCPGCGLTRSFVHLSRGNWQQAWGLNPIGPILYAYIAAQLPLAAMRWIPDAPRHRWFAWWRVDSWGSINQWLGFSLALGLVVQWTIKMTWRNFL